MKPRSIKSPDIDPEQERKELQTLHWDTDAELFNLARNAAMKAGATGQDGQYTYQCPLPCCSRLFDRKYVCRDPHLFPLPLLDLTERKGSELTISCSLAPAL